VGSGLAVFSALVTIFMIRPLTADGMKHEEEAFRQYLIDHGYDVSQMGLRKDEYDGSSTTGSATEEKKNDLRATEIERVETSPGA